MSRTRKSMTVFMSPLPLAPSPKTPTEATYDDHPRGCVSLRRQDMTDSLQISVDSDKEAAVMYLRGWLSIESSPDLRDHLLAMLRRQSPPATRNQEIGDRGRQRLLTAKIGAGLQLFIHAYLEVQK